MLTSFGTSTSYSYLFFVNPLKSFGLIPKLESLASLDFSSSVGFAGSVGFSSGCVGVFGVLGCSGFVGGVCASGAFTFTTAVLLASGTESKLVVSIPCALNLILYVVSCVTVGTLNVKLPNDVIPSVDEPVILLLSELICCPPLALTSSNPPVSVKSKVYAPNGSVDVTTIVTFPSPEFTSLSVERILAFTLI